LDGHAFLSPVPFACPYSRPLLLPAAICASELPPASILEGMHVLPIIFAALLFAAGLHIFFLSRLHPRLFASASVCTVRAFVVPTGGYAANSAPQAAVKYDISRNRARKQGCKPNAKDLSPLLTV
jgi:hypothetical protein